MATSSSSVGELRSGQSPGSTGLNVQGGGGRVNLTDEQYKYLAYALVVKRDQVMINMLAHPFLIELRVRELLNK